MRLFVESGCVEPIAKVGAATADDAERERRELYETRKYRAAFCLAFLKDMAKEIRRIDGKLEASVNLRHENRLITLDEYEEVFNNTEELLCKVDEMEGINNRLIDLRAEKTRANAQIERLLPYEKLEIDAERIGRGEFASVRCGVAPIERREELLTRLEGLAAYESAESEKLVAAALAHLNEDEEEVSAILAECEFSAATFDFAGAPARRIEAHRARIAEIDAEIKECALSARRYFNLVPTVKILYDYCCMELTKLDIFAGAEKTKRALALEGWVPEDRAVGLEKAIREKCKRVVVEFSDPAEGDKPPTELKNGGFASAFSGITDMFGRPGYEEKDPNLFVALFYFLIFGIMIGDAGYGLIMSIVCFGFTAIAKPVKNSGKMMLLFAFCGISTVIWGALFGGWFAIDLPANSVLAKLRWFNPLEEPLKMFMLSLGIGVLQIGTGFFLSGAAKIRNGRVMEGILSDFGWDLILVGLLLLSPKIMLFVNAIDSELAWFGPMGAVGTRVAAVGAAMVVVGGAWGKKNPVKMLGGAFGSAYGSINVVSDLLSYSRLFGLGLTTGVIGLVMNKLGMIMVGLLGPAGWIVAVAVWLIGHAFNIAINLLGAYVHDCRLQYIEFFGRFYVGDGRAFKPLGNDLKYTYLDN